MPIFGNISTVDEILNIHDNFGKAELRFDCIESHLKKAVNPIIVDCGVNVGITIRWWHYLNPGAKIIGFDMMKEAHEFTLKKIGASSSWYVPLTCALSSSEGKAIDINFDDPLFGENSVNSTNKKYKREVKTCTLDNSLENIAVGGATIDVLKIDIEGHGAEALRGAAATIKKTRFVIFETHSKDEISESSDMLIKAGFKIIGMRNRTLFYLNCVFSDN
jgi:FkbM family methyltransferase